MIKSRFSISRFLAAASVLLCVVSSAKAQDKVLLRMNLQPGQTFDQGYAMEMKSSSVISKKQRVDTTITTNFGLHNEVLGVDNSGNIKLKTTYQQIALKSSSAYGPKKSTFSYDSSHPPKQVPLGAQTLAGLVGQSLIVTMSPQGKALKVEGMDTIIQRMMAGTKNPQERATMQATLKNTLESVTKSFAGIERFPETAIIVGDSWTSVVSSPILPQLLMKYTLVSSKDDVATIAVLADFSPNPKTPALKMSQFQMKTSISGTESGVMRVDEKTGLVISSELNMRMKDVVSMTAPKSTFKSKTKPVVPYSITVYVKGIVRGWTVKLPQ